MLCHCISTCAIWNSNGNCLKGDVFKWQEKNLKSVKPIIVLLLLAILAVSVWLGIEKFKNSQEVGSTENKTKTEAPKKELKPKTFCRNRKTTCIYDR